MPDINQTEINLRKKISFYLRVVYQRSLNGCLIVLLFGSRMYRRVPVPTLVQQGAIFSQQKKWIINCNIEGIDTHTHTGINTCIVCVLRAMFDVTGIRYQTYWFSFNVWWHWWWKSDDDDDDVICFYLSSVECCTGMLWQCVDPPVFYNRTVWDEPRKAKRNVLGLSSCFFYVLYIEIHFFQIKWLLVSKSLFSETTHTHATGLV